MRIGVCDDQKEIREMILDKIKKFCRAEDAAELVSYKSGREVLEAPCLPDLLFLDIQMPEMDGIETAKNIRRRNRQMIIIFVTVTEDHVFRSFDVGAFHYLVKPFEDKKFAQVLQSAVRQFRERESERTGSREEMPGLVITAKGKHIMIPVEEIVYAEVFDRKIILQ